MYLESIQTSKMEIFAKMVGCIQPLTIFAKLHILGVSQAYECSSHKSKQTPGGLWFISQKNTTAISADFLPF